MRHYTLGFAFTPDMQQVLLIKKQRPAWQAGLLNGLGGKMDDEEIAQGRIQASMSREFSEECGILIPPNQWRQYAILRGLDFRVYCLSATSVDLERAETLTDEAVELLPVNFLSKSAHRINNLLWLVHAAVDAHKEEFMMDVMYSSAGLPG